MHSLTRVSCAVTLALGLSGCGTLYKLDVVAFSNPDLELGKTYVVLSGDSNVSINSSEFQGYADQVERALSEKGYVRVGEDELSATALGIYLTAGISDPTKRYHQVKTALVEPAYDETVTREARSNNSGQSGGTSGQANRGLASVEPPPPDVLVGYEKQQFATTVYVKSLNIRVIDLQSYVQDFRAQGRDNAVPKEVWSVDVETTGLPGDLSEVVPVMIAAAQPYFGTATGERLQIKLNEKDRRVQAIKGE